MKLCDFYKQEGRLAAERDRVERALQNAPHDLIALRRLFTIHKIEGETKAAFDVLAKIIERYPEQMKVYAGDVHHLGALLREAKRYDEAITVYQKAVELEQNSNQQWYHRYTLAQVLFEAEKLEEAEKLVKEIVHTANNASQQNQATQLLMQILTKAGRAAEYIAELEKRVRDSPKDEESLRQLADHYWSSQNFAKAAEMGQKLVAINPSFDHYQRLINAYSNIQDFDKLIATYLEIIKKFPNQKQNYTNNLLWTYANAGRIDEAVQAAEELLKASPEDPSPAEQYARILMQARRLDQAIAAFETAIKRKRNAQEEWRWRMEIAQVYQQQGKHKEALALIQELAKSAPDDNSRQHGNQMLVQIHRNLGSLPSFLAELEDKAAKNPKDKQALRLLGDAYQANGDYVRAAALYRKLVEVDPAQNHYEVWLNLLANAQMHEERIAAFEEYSRKFPYQAQHRFQELVWSYQAAGKGDVAIKMAQENAKKNPQQGNAYANLGNLLRNMQRHDEAIAAYEEAIKLNNDAEVLWSWRLQIAQALLEQQKYADAEKKVRDALAASLPDHFHQQARSILIRIAQSTGGLEKMQKEVEDKLSANPKDRQTLQHLIHVYQLQNNQDGLSQLYQKLVEVDPQPHHFQNLINQLMMAKKFKEAMAFCDVFMEKFPRYRRNLTPTLLNIYAQTGEKDKAILVGQEYVATQPGNPQVRALFAYSLKTLLEYDLAIATYQEAIDMSQDAGSNWEWLFQMAECYRDKGDIKRVEALIPELLRAIPYPEARERVNNLLKRPL